MKYVSYYFFLIVVFAVFFTFIYLIIHYFFKFHKWKGLGILLNVGKFGFIAL